MNVKYSIIKSIGNTWFTYEFPESPLFALSRTCGVYVGITCQDR